MEQRFKHLLGKRVEFVDSEGERRVGVLKFAGFNKHLHEVFQVTINRCPVWPVEPNSIKEHISNCGPIFK